MKNTTIHPKSLSKSMMTTQFFIQLGDRDAVVRRRKNSQIRSKIQQKPIRFLYPFKFKVVILLTVLLPLVQISETKPFLEESMMKGTETEHLVNKRESNLDILHGASLSLSNNSSNQRNSILNNNHDITNGGKGNSRSTRKVDDDGIFGQLVILAQEEAKCLQRFGGQPFSAASPPAPAFITEDFYSPFLCSKTSSQFAQCEICRNLTARIRTREECSLFCGKSDAFCRELCFSINKAVSDGAQAANDEAHLRRRDEHDKASNNTFHIFSQIPHVFCEGVLEDSNNPGSTLFNSNNQAKQQLPSSEGGKWHEITNHFIVLKWNSQKGGRRGDNNNSNTSGGDSKSGSEPVVFVIETYSTRSKEWEILGKTPYNLQQINVTFLSDNYTWRVSAVGPSGFMEEVTSTDYKTLDGYVRPGPPRKIYVVKTIPVDSNSSIVNVLIGWDPPKEKTCFYKIVLETHEGAEKPIRIKEPLGVHQHWFTLLAETHYSILITSRDPSWDQYSESNLTRLDFKTPTCLESYNYRFDKCAPPPPRGIETKLRENPSDAKTVGVLVLWKPPQRASETNVVLQYNVTITRLTFKNGGSVTNLNSGKNQLNGSFPYMNFSGSSFSKLMRPSSNSNSNSNSTTVYGNITHLQFPGLEPNAEYQVMVQAISSRGASKPAQHHLVTRIVKEPLVVSPLNNWLYLAIPVCIMMLILIVCNMGRVYLHKRQVKMARNQYFQSMEERDALSADWSIVPLTEEASTWKLFDDNFPKDKWEIVSENLIIGEVIGQGAFGVVRRAKIARRKLQPTTLKYLDKASPRLDGDRRDPDMETVAVKMLKVSATREDREQLVKEIMTMQSLGFHPQIVGLIGACTRGRSLSLVLEYCSGGDLLTFIRKVRAKYWPTLGLSDAKKNSSTSMSREVSCRTGSGGSGGSRIKNLNSSDCNNESEDNSPINYADIEHFSDYSSSSKSEHLGNPLHLAERHNSPTICQSPAGSHHSQNGNEDDDNDEFRPIDEKDVLSYARQIAMGMEYLEKNRIVHRDLACRNCLLMGDHKQVKLSDFGLSRDIYTWNVYHQKSNGKLPIKWMAIESIFTHVFTTKSDVWSYGIVLWELVTLGGTPYPGLGNTELFHLLKSGYRMERPDNCSEELYALMKKCWRTSPSARPNYTELRNYVQDMMEAAEPNLYLSLMADIPSDYFRLGSRSDLLQMTDKTDGSIDLYNGSCTSNNNHRNSKKYAGYHNTNSTYSTSSTTPSHRHNPISTTSSSTSSQGGGGCGGGGGGPPIDIQSSNCTARYTTLTNKGESSQGGYSRSNSIASSSNGKSSANSSGKFTLGSVPERYCSSNGDGDTSPAFTHSPTNSTSGLLLLGSGESSSNNKTLNNNCVKESNRVGSGVGDGNCVGLFENKPNHEERDSVLQHTLKLTKSASFDGGGNNLSNQMRRSPTNPTSSSSSTSSPNNPLQFIYPFRQATNNMTIIENKTYGLTDD